MFSAPRQVTKKRSPSAFSVYRIMRVIIPIIIHCASCRTFIQVPDLVPNKWVPLSYEQAPVENPLKGFMSYYDSSSNNFPHSMEWVYLPLSQLMTGMDEFTFDKGLEPYLRGAEGRGNHLCFRVYLDSPGKPSGVPRFIIDGGLRFYEYGEYGGGLSPDYTNEKLVRALENFIRALGAVYDGDPRIGFITIGLLGFWGEWHTYPHTEWFAPLTVQNRILRTFDESFDTTRLLVRYPAGESPHLDIGFHDDSFAYNTLPPVSWHFWPQIEKAGCADVWKREPVGGELRPEIQSGIFDDPPASEAENFSRCVETTHCSWLLAYDIFNHPGFTGAKFDRALDAARLLGYEITVTGVSAGYTEDRFNLTVTMKNIGVAPFYYAWDVEIAVVGDNGKVERLWKTNWDITSVMPGDNGETSFSFVKPVEELPAKPFTIILRVKNPLQGGKTFSFANRRMNDLLKGWLVLGRLENE
ncbi:MAG: DUF4832 domain-containing protein [Spirochaetales bacterium]|nr:DUF4832 domain-containing protein [Spirochaetales bacterium]